jgi:hypothetical protein
VAQRSDSSIPELPSPDLEGFEDDSLKGREEANWKQLQELSSARHDNAIAIHKTIRWLIPSALILGFLGFASLSVIYVLHLLLPSERRWLSADEVHHIHSMIFSGIVGGAIAILAKMYLGDVRKD